jgi:6-pyruvoyl-tetrahydropterin synthase
VDSYKVRVSKQIDIAMAHHLYPGSGVPHCERLHGHNWIVEATCEFIVVLGGGEPNILFGNIKRDLIEVVHNLFDHDFINKVPGTPFYESMIGRWQPTTENFALYILAELRKRNSSYKRVTVFENYPNNKAEVEHIGE